MSKGYSLMNKHRNYFRRIGLGFVIFGFFFYMVPVNAAEPKDPFFLPGASISFLGAGKNAGFAIEAGKFYNPSWLSKTPFNSQFWSVELGMILDEDKSSYLLNPTVAQSTAPIIAGRGNFRSAHEVFLCTNMGAS